MLWYECGGDCDGGVNGNGNCHSDGDARSDGDNDDGDGDNAPMSQTCRM